MSGTRALRPILVALVLVALLPVAPARAEIGAQDGEIGFDYALQRFDGALLGKTGRRWSLRAGKHETGLLQWEGQVMRGRVEETPLPGAERSVTFTLALANLVLNFHPRSDVVPYVLLGIGVAETKIEAVGLSSRDTDTGYQLGGGARFFFGEGSRVALRIEATVPGGDAFEHSYFHPSVGAGLTVRIGRGSRPRILPAAIF